nr:phospho-sugar mutase [Lachnospiraceae bacterium]
ASWCKKNGITLWDQMLAVYEKYGYYKEDLYTITLKGIDGSKQISAIMDKLRSNPPKSFGELQVVSMRDYESGEITELATGAKSPTGLPKSNVLYFDLTNDSWCCARPSGTEPKIKFYMGVKGTSLEDAKAKVAKLTEELKAVL